MRMTYTFKLNHHCIILLDNIIVRKNLSGRLPNPATPSLQMPLPVDPTSVILRKCHLTISVQSRSLPVPTIPLPRASALAHATACSPSLP